MGLHIQSYKSYTLTNFSNDDWACNKDDRRTTANYCIYFGSNLVSWSLKKQHVVARSSTKSKYKALAHVSCEITWLESLLKKLHISLEEVPITWYDNLSASQLASNPVFNARTKYIEVYVHFIRNKILDKRLEVRYIPSKDQFADNLTKTLSG